MHGGTVKIVGLNQFYSRYAGKSDFVFT